MILEVHMKRLVCVLVEQDKDALRALANKEFREVNAQAALIIHQELERMGLISKSLTNQQAELEKNNTAGRGVL